MIFTDWVKGGFEDPRERDGQEPLKEQLWRPIR